MSIQPHQQVIPKLFEGVVTHRENTDFLCSQIIRNQQGNLHKFICEHEQRNHIQQVARSGNSPDRASLGYQRDALCSASVCLRREISHRNRRSVRSHSKSQTYPSMLSCVRGLFLPTNEVRSSISIKKSYYNGLKVGVKVSPAHPLQRNN